MWTIEAILLVTSLLLFLGVAASKISDRLGVPALLLFLIIGMLAGSEAIGGIHFSDPWLAKSLGVLALIFILFSGGLDTCWKDIRQIFWPALSLSTIGVLLTTLIVGWFATCVLPFSILEGLLLGAIVSSTDAAAVFNVLRSRNVSLRGKLQPLLELESGSNDPMAVFLTLGIIGLLMNPNQNVWHLIPKFILDMGVGTAAGYMFGRISILIINRLKLAYEGLYPVLMLSLVLMAYATATTLHGNGFLTVYIMGVFLGNTNVLHKNTLKNFCEGLTWLMQIVMFVALGLLVFPSRIVPVIGAGLLISIFLMFIARPVSVFICLFFANMKYKDKAMVAWVGLRGAVPIVLATFPLLAGTPKADIIFNIVFFIVLTSILLQGTTIPFVSRLLKVDAPMKKKRAYPIEFEQTKGINASLEDLLIPYTSDVAGKPLIEIGVPQGALIVLISRDDKFFIPNGTTILNGGDVLLVLASKHDLQKLQLVLAKNRKEPES